MSLGVVVQSRDGRTPLESVLSAADQALYEAKRGGRNRTVLGRLPPTATS